MTLSEIIYFFNKFSYEHQILAFLIVFILSFGESLAFISLFLPATIILLSIGPLINDHGLTFFPIWLAATGGAFIGDWLSYWLGCHYKNRVRNMWPISSHPQVLDRGHIFFNYLGGWSIFISRFLGPLRAVIPLVAGICAMPKYYFQLANLLSAMIWAFSVLSVGAFGLSWIAQ